MLYYYYCAILFTSGIISGCDNKEEVQRKAFTEFLQSSAMQNEKQLPMLNPDQKQQFGNYANNYDIIYNFSQQINRIKDNGFSPVVAHFSAIQTPKDYITQREAFRKDSGVLNELNQQFQAARAQADSNKSQLKMPDDLKTVFDNFYAQKVTKPASQISTVLPALQSLTRDAAQAGDFLFEQGNNVKFDGLNVQFDNEQAAATYNQMMDRLRLNGSTLDQADYLLNRL